MIMEEQDSAQGAVDWTNSQLAEHQRVRGFTVWPDEDFPRTHTLKVKNQVVIDTIVNGLEQSAPMATPAGCNPNLRPPGPGSCSSRSRASGPQGSYGTSLPRRRPGSRLPWSYRAAFRYRSRAWRVPR